MGQGHSADVSSDGIDERSGVATSTMNKRRISTATVAIAATVADINPRAIFAQRLQDDVSPDRLDWIGLERLAVCTVLPTQKRLRKP